MVLTRLLLALKAHSPYWNTVFVPSNTCLPTWLAAGDRYVVVPIEPYASTYQMNTGDLQRRMQDDREPVCAVVPVHLYGIPANIEAIAAVAARYGAVVIEDCAQAHGATYRGRRIGGHGNTCAWSFYPTKNLGAMGDAGAVTTSDPAIAERVRALRAYGCAGAVNSRMDEMQAAILRAKKSYLPAWNYRRAQNAAQYMAGLAHVPDVILPTVPEYVTPCRHQFVVRHPRRDALRVHLTVRGIETLIYYPVPPHRLLGYDYSLPVADQLSAEVLSLPVGPHLNADHIETVIQAVKEFEL